MKNKVVNLANDSENICDAMKSTFLYQSNWILKDSPSITEIFNKFPKYKDMPFLLSRKSQFIYFINLIIYVLYLFCRSIETSKISKLKNLIVSTKTG